MSSKEAPGPSGNKSDATPNNVLVVVAPTDSLSIGQENSRDFESLTDEDLSLDTPASSSVSSTNSFRKSLQSVFRGKTPGASSEKEKSGNVSSNNSNDSDTSRSSKSFLSRIYNKKQPLPYSIVPSKLVSVKAIGFSEDANPRYRPTMEDAHIIIDNFRSTPNEAFFAIYDGHGGRTAVEAVARNLHCIFTDALENVGSEEPSEGSQESIKKAFIDTYLKTDEILLKEKCHYNGTTSVTCYLKTINDRKMLITANAGDARAVLSRGMSAVRLSYDHKASDGTEITRVTEGGGFVAAQRVNGVLSVSRALGDHAMKKVVISTPHISIETLTPDDKFIILACDGLWDVITDDEAIKMVRERLAKSGDIQSISKKLVKMALDKGSTDNISIMIVVI